MRNNGFTLIDLIITLSVMSILLTIGLPSVSTQIQNARVKAATNSLLEAINLTRSQAVFANKRATIRKQNEWEGGWEIFIDGDNDGIRDNDEATVRRYEQLKGIRIVANRPIKNYVSYIGTGESRNASGTSGGGFQAGTFTICPAATGKGYELILARGGRVRVAEINEEKCNSV
ncbi:MAG TPA: GspH/FimT family pseudopilin [Cellvibrio sp.]|nr:GspH/FimT family pseudopilin [Cellvibrio sp.]